jgi:hypothetical protein
VSTKDPTIWPLLLIPKAKVRPVAPGTSMVVKLPPVYKKPLDLPMFAKSPTIWPLLLIP